jgi:two-component system, NarL family, response regulator NreC
METTIILVDDHELLRQGLKLLLETQPDFHVSGQVGSGQEALALAQALQPDIIVLDMLMPGMNGLETIRILQERVPRSRIIVLSMSDEETYVRRAMQGGAMAYVLKDNSSENLVQAVRSVLAGEQYLSPKLVQRAVKAYLQPADPVEIGIQALTAREKEILHLCAKGLSNPEIGQKLSISPRTVESHRANLMLTLGLRSRAELVSYAHRHRLLED